jgi:hypothetical protein
MSSEPLDPGQPGEPPEDTPGDDVLDGEVIAFPGTATPDALRPPAGQPGELRPIIPGHLKTWAGIRKAIRWRVRRYRHHVLWHLARSPKRLALALV